MEEKENIKLAFFLNLGFSLFELIGGIFTNSISILSDAIHDFGDSLSIAISLFLEKVSLKSVDEKYTYGYKRYSCLGGLITSLILLIGSIVVIISSLGRLLYPVEVNHTGMLIFAIFGILINGYAAYKTSKSVSINEKSVNLHMLEDVLGWIAVLVGSLLIKISGWNFIDSLLSIGISIFIFVEALKNTVEVLRIFMEKKPDEIHIDKLKETILKVNNVVDVHHVHIWSLDGVENFITMHIKINKKATKNNYEEIKKEVKKILFKEGIKHSTLELEYEDCKEKNCK